MYGQVYKYLNVNYFSISYKLYLVGPIMYFVCFGFGLNCYF